MAARTQLCIIILLMRKTFEFTPVNARKIRLTLIQGDGKHWRSIAELKILRPRAVSGRDAPEAKNNSFK